MWMHVYVHRANAHAHVCMWHSEKSDSGMHLDRAGLKWHESRSQSFGSGMHFALAKFERHESRSRGLKRHES
jgi:hypothetical protein